MFHRTFKTKQHGFNSGLKWSIWFDQL